MDGTMARWPDVSRTLIFLKRHGNLVNALSIFIQKCKALKKLTRLSVATLFLFLLSTVVAKKKVFRYTEVENSINGTFGVPFTVSASNDCSTEALKNNASAIKVIWGNGSIQCSLVTNIRSFLPLKVEETKSTRYYIADLRESDTCSRNVETVTEIWSTTPKCDLNEQVCTEILTMTSYCASQNAILTDCTNLQCRENFRLVETQNCCPNSYHFIYDGRCIRISAIPANTAKTQKAIFDLCDEGSVPATIYNNKSADVFAKLAAGRFQYIVIGLRIKEGEEWSKEGFKWVSENKEEYRNWGWNQPTHKDGSGNAKIMTVMYIPSGQFYTYWYSISVEGVFANGNMGIICSRNPVKPDA